jgi:hypothetical protein
VLANGHLKKLVNPVMKLTSSLRTILNWTSYLLSNLEVKLKCGTARIKSTRPRDMIKKTLISADKSSLILMNPWNKSYLTLRMPRLPVLVGFQLRITWQQLEQVALSICSIRQRER